MGMERQRPSPLRRMQLIHPVRLTQRESDPPPPRPSASTIHSFGMMRSDRGKVQMVSWRNAHRSRGPLKTHGLFGSHTTPRPCFGLGSLDHNGPFSPLGLALSSPWNELWKGGIRLY